MNLIVLYRDELAARFGIPMSHLTCNVTTDDRLVLIDVLIQGRDLTPAQERIFRDFLAEKAGAGLQVIGMFPSTSPTGPNA